MALAGKSITGAMGLGEVGSQLRLISKTICVVLSFLLVVGAVPVRAFALEGEPDTSAVCTALGAQFEGTNKVANEYDDLNRVYRKTYFAAEGHDPFAAEISHLNWQDEQNRTTSLVRGIEYTYSSGMLSMTDLYYNYDHKGNIVAERVWKPSEDNPLLEKYTYDAKGQLSRCDSSRQNASFTYTYDKAGNIQSVKKYAYTTGTLGTAQQTQSYTYSTGSWGDLLTSYDGHAITYDGAGNIIGYDGATFDWCGRELKEIRKSGHTYHYHYGADGGRTAKVVDGVRTDFLLDSGRIAAQKMGDRITWFFYDSTGSRIGLFNRGVAYYYVYNLQGDEIALVKAATGQVAARYDYDAWGTCTVRNALGQTVGDDNPFRFKGYYYDSETGRYLTGSRYYDPEL